MEWVSSHDPSKLKPHLQRVQPEVSSYASPPSKYYSWRVGPFAAWC